MLYRSLLHFIGCSNYLRTVDTAMWVTATTHLATDAPEYFSGDFYCQCHQLVSDHFGWDLNSEVGVTNALQVYLYLIENHSTKYRGRMIYYTPW